MDLISKPWQTAPRVLSKIVLMENLYCYIHHKAVKSRVKIVGIDLPD